MTRISHSLDRYYRMSPLTLMNRLSARGWFVGDSWKAWKVVIKAAYGLPLDDTDLALFRQIAGDRRPPTKPVKALVILKGRRGGGSLAVAFNAFFCATCGIYQLTPGETGTISIIACDRRQARVIFKYVEAFFEAEPFHKLVERKTLEAIYLTNGLAIEIRTASFKTLRGYTNVLCVGDEPCFWNVDGANPDTEIIKAWIPSMATIPQAMLVLVSSPYARRGVMWDYHKKYFGQDTDDVLVIQGPSRLMNPSLPESIVAQAYEDDPAAAAAEYGAEFRADIENYIRREVVEACVVSGRYEVPLVDGVAYVAGFDAAGGSGSDEQALAIGHSELRDGRWVHILDCVTSVKPPFSPQQVVEDFCEILKRYKITHMIGDRYAGEWPREQFVKHGIEYRLTDKPKSDLYRELLPFINSGSIELLDHPKLCGQLCALERRTARGGRDTIDHSPNGHDDLVNASAIALVTSARRVALPPLQLLGGTLMPRSAAEIEAENEREWKQRHEEGAVWLREKIEAAGGCFFPGD